MDILVKHGTTNITQYVISYAREHNICSGIGTLELVLSSTYSTAINPHDTFSIYENGDFKVKYYVSDVSENAPEGTIRLQCQDRSKYLVDYFIADQYTIDYPSYTRYWIETFFDQAGIPYSFTTDSQGNLLSNYTVLGLQPAYDQIVMLCQMSGWYFYFDGNGTAIIGSLTTDVSSGGSIDKTDILSIKKTTDDKMLRNRAVVWGGYDPLRHQNAYANVVTHTPYNYDNNDIRTMVISNNNIPNLASAYDIANMLIKEFAKPTIVKEISVWGARNFNLGEFLRVTSDVYKGRGLITSFSVNMDRSGLTTTVLLDERCPRLFGFFNFGDYVYVGTFGDGIWRKHVKFDPAWYDFSEGLTNLEITDLHINNGVYSSVGSNGEAYYALYDLPWREVTISGLMSSQEDSVPSGGSIILVPFSGIKARATIVDKVANIIKFGVDTYSGLNTGDYLMSYSGFMHQSAFSGVMSSGVTISGGYRSWIVEFDPMTGELINNEYGGYYPVSYSGNYNMVVLDLENDGINDYISVMAVGSGLINSGNSFQMGYHYTQPFTQTKDYTSESVVPVDTAGFAVDGDRYYAVNGQNIRVQSPSSLVAIDDQISGLSFVFAIGDDGKARKISFVKDFNGGLNSWMPVASTITSSTANTEFTSAGSTIMGIYPNWFGNTFRIFYRKGVIFGTGSSVDFYYLDWDATTDSWSDPTFMDSHDKLANGVGVVKSIVVDNTLYVLLYYVLQPNTVGGFYYSSGNLYVDLVKIDLVYATILSQAHLIDFIAGPAPESTIGAYYFYPGLGEPPSKEGTAGILWSTNFGIFQDGHTIQILGRAEHYYYQYDPNINISHEYVFVGDASVIQYSEVYNENTVRRFPYPSQRCFQLTENKGFIGATQDTALSYVFNGTTFRTFTTTSSAIPIEYDESRILPLFNTGRSKYITYDGTPGIFYLCNADSLTLEDAITPPTGYTVKKFCSNALDSYGSSIYSVLRKDETGDLYLLPYNFSGFDFTKIMTSWTLPTSYSRTFNFGFFIIEDSPYLSTPYTANVYYVDFGQPISSGTSFLVLQRDGETFYLIEQEEYPIRLDISNNSPVLTAGSGSQSFRSNFIYQNELSVATAAGSDNYQVNDYRYALLQTSSGVPVASGVPVNMQVIFVTNSGIFTGDATAYSGGFIIFDSIPSGTLGRIETTNFTSPSQFIFVTTSGDNPMFYQRDNDKLYFTPYSGLPDSRATIIRIDDYL